MAPAHHPERYLRRRVGITPTQRAAAVGALVLDLAAVGILVALVLQRPLLTLVLLAVALAFVGAFFVALTSTGARRHAATVAAAVLAVGLVVGLLAWSPAPDEPGWGAPAVLVLLVGAVLLQRHALRVPPPASADLFEVRAADRVCRHPVLIVNPRSGDGKAARLGLAQAARDLGIDVVELAPGDDLDAVARRAAAGGADALGMAGGDGSLACVAQVALDHGIPFVCVPSGTRNHFALDLGLDRDDPHQALSAFLSGEERQLDYATVNGRMFLNNVALGVYAAVVADPAYREAKLETTLGLLPKLAADGGPWFDLRFDVPDHGHLDSAALLMVSNNPYEVKGEFGRRRTMDAGELGVVTVDPQHLGDLVGLTVLAATRRPEASRALWAWSAPTFEVASGQARVAAGVDGETLELGAPLRFASVPRGLRVLVPKGTAVGLHEQHLGARGAYSGLLEVAFNLPGRAPEALPSE